MIKDSRSCIIRLCSSFLSKNIDILFSSGVSGRLDKDSSLCEVGLSSSPLECFLPFLLSLSSKIFLAFLLVSSIFFRALSSSNCNILMRLCSFYTSSSINFLDFLTELRETGKPLVSLRSCLVLSNPVLVILSCELSISCRVVVAAVVGAPPLRVKNFLSLF